jgi:hypothetical protein
MTRRFAAAVVIAGTAMAAEYAADGDRWWKHVEYLASDQLEGRDTGSPGHRKAAEYVAGEFERAGLKPAGTQSYFQPVALKAQKLDEPKSSLELIGPEGAEKLVLGEDAMLTARGEPAPQLEADVVFVGYGLKMPDYKHDDLAGLDLRGKVALYISGSPASMAPAVAAHAGAERWTGLREAGAVGAIGIQNPAHMDIPWDRMKLNRGEASMFFPDPKLNNSRGLKLGAAVNPARAPRWFAGTGHTPEELFALSKERKPLPVFPLKVKVRSSVSFTSRELTSDNVAGLLPGRDPKLKDEYVVISAHLDHEGRGTAINGDEIYNGAMDNASGTATLIEIAHSLASRREGLRRSVIFLAVTGEEKGLLGAKFFAHHPTVKPEQIVANLNVDMFLPIFALKALTVFGLEESDLGDLSQEVAKSLDIGIAPDRKPERVLFVRSDQYQFVRRGIPALFFAFAAEPGSPEEKQVVEWLRTRYHAPSDDVNQPVDKASAARFNAYIAALTERVANRDARPQWKPSSFFKRFAAAQ